MKHETFIMHTPHSTTSPYTAVCEPCFYYARCESMDDARACLDDHIENSR